MPPKNKTPKILIVAPANSIHLARWLDLIPKTWEIHLFSSIDDGWAHQDIKNAVIWTGRKPNLFSNLWRLARQKYLPNNYQNKLARLVKQIRPDLIHVMELQTAGYLMLNVRKNWQGQFPKWLVTNWGSDISLFGQLFEHREKIKAILKLADFYSCECERDIGLAKKLQFCGVSLPVFPNAGGFDLKKIAALKSELSPSQRKMIMLKGYQGWVGRALVGLRALEEVTKYLAGYEIVIYLADESSGVPLAAKLFSAKTKIPVTILPLDTPHAEILKYHGKSRISLGLNIGDAISTSFLEAVAMGSFPIQSDSSCADEWIKNGQTGLLVPAEDPKKVTLALKKALTDDKLVDYAAKENAKTVSRRLDNTLIKEKIAKFYQKIFESSVDGK